MKSLIALLLFSCSLLYADFTLQLNDGRRILLRDNGTWEYVAQEVKQLAHFQGDGMQNTETFSVSSKEWRIRWRSTEIMTIMVYTADGEATDIFSGKEGQSVMRSAGSFYFTIMASTLWNVWVIQ